MFERKEYKLETTINEFGRLVWSLTLYCAGRRTYAPSICEDIIMRNAEKILFPWRAHIIAHVMGRFAETFEERVAAEREHRAAREAGDPDAWEKAWRGGRLGADFDENGWMRAVTYLAKHDGADPRLVNANWDGEDAPITVTFSDMDDFWFAVTGALRNDYAQDGMSVFTAEQLTALVERNAGDLNEKWAANILRDLTDDTFVSFLANGDDRKTQAWEPLLGLARKALSREPTDGRGHDASETGA